MLCVLCIGPGAAQQLVDTSKGYAVLLKKGKEPLTAGLMDVYGKVRTCQLGEIVILCSMISIILFAVSGGGIAVLACIKLQSASVQVPAYMPALCWPFGSCVTGITTRAGPVARCMC